MTIRVLIADDQPLVRQGLRSVLSCEPDIEVVGEAADGDAALQVAVDTAPDVVLMDIRMPGVDGLTATGAVVRALPETRVLVLTTFDLDEYVFQALRAGASAFLLKDETPEAIVAAVRAVHAGHTLVAPVVTRRLTARWSPPRPSTALERLTAREREVLALVADGATNAEIGRQLVVEESTVKTHIGRLLAKLECRDRVHLVITAYECGLAGG